MRLTAASNLGIAAGYAAVGAFSRRLDSYSFLIAFLGALLLPGLFILICGRPLTTCYVLGATC